MRVRFNHGTVGWHSYTGFLAYRRRLAALAGLDLEAMDGFGGTRPWSSVTDELAPFLSMTDGVGFVRASECGRVARRLRGLVELIPVDDPDHTLTLALVEGLLEAASAQERLRFASEEAVRPRRKRGAAPRTDEDPAPSEADGRA